MKNVILFLLLTIRLPVWGQHTVSVEVRGAETNRPLPGATLLLESTKAGFMTDSAGRATLTNVPDGPQRVRVSFMGYETLRHPFRTPVADTLRLRLEPGGHELEEIIVTTTRGTRTIADEPTRLEVIATEELEEKSDMNASNISTMLKETPGIQVQQTSATSANQTFRIQGLDGRYTQLLQNGLPLYSGFASGLSIMQIPPLDLKQVEIVKGSSSTLYGGGAIAGIVNLVTKEPTAEREASLMVNGTTAGGLDLNTFYSEKWQKVGVTLFLSHNSQRAYDPNRDGFSDIPQSRRLNINPRLFVYLSDRTTASVGVNASVENRLGGDVPAIRNDLSGYYTERNRSDRYTTQLRVSHRFSEHTSVYLKNSFTFFDRTLTVPDYRFGGRQRAGFTELGVNRYGQRSEWVAGLNLWTDQFREDGRPLSTPNRNYTLNTVGGFVQNTFRPEEFLTLETGLRLDHQATYGTFLLPRVSALFRISDGLSSRLGGGLGYKSPTVFTEETEQRLYENIRPIDPLRTKAETSQGVNWDVNYATDLTDDLNLSFNHLFFYTRIRRPLVLTENPDSTWSYVNADGHTDSRGFETNLKLTWHDFRLYTYYTFTDTKRHYGEINRPIPLTARHRAGFVLMYEVEGKLRLGYELYHTGSQELESGTRTRPYWLMGFMAERRWKHLSLYINFENFTDTRLSRFQPMVSGTRQRPQFVREIWAPTDGRIINGGIKLFF
ncbi:TonB-dependent receptor [Larkinella soli]|uniref:TonB-dependent receptor n=1 Tax=Larkinella soli TaxID=1770527 RepID=UPI000FFC2C04|nr:TonB-dependent receptor [Larkinella soli]